MIDTEQKPNNFPILYKFLCRKNTSKLLTNRMTSHLSSDASVIFCCILQMHKDLFKDIPEQRDDWSRMSLRRIERITGIHGTIVSKCVKELAFKRFIHIRYFNRRYYVRLHDDKLLPLVGITSNGKVLSDVAYKKHPSFIRFSRSAIFDAMDKSGPFDSSNIDIAFAVSKYTSTDFVYSDDHPMIITCKEVLAYKKHEKPCISLKDSFAKIVCKYEEMLELLFRKQFEPVFNRIKNKFKRWSRKNKATFFSIKKTVAKVSARVIRKAKTIIIPPPVDAHPMTEFAIALPFMMKHRRGTKIYKKCGTWLDQLAAGTFFKRRKKLSRFVIDSKLDQKMLTKKFSETEIKEFLVRLSYIKEQDTEKFLVSYSLVDLMYNDRSQTHYYSFLVQVMDENKWSFIKRKNKLQSIANEIDEKKLFPKSISKCLELMQIRKSNKRDYLSLVGNLMTIRDFRKSLPRCRVPLHDELVYDYCINHLAEKHYSGYHVGVNDLALNSKSFRKYVLSIWHEGATGLECPLLTYVNDYLDSIECNNDAYVQVLMKKTVQIGTKVTDIGKDPVYWHASRKIMTTMKFAKRLVANKHAILINNPIIAT